MRQIQFHCKDECCSSVHLLSTLANAIIRMATRLSAWQAYRANRLLLSLLRARARCAHSYSRQLRSNFPPYPQAAASTIAMQNASVNDVFKKMWPLLRKSRILSWFTAPSVEWNENVLHLISCPCDKRSIYLMQRDLPFLHVRSPRECRSPSVRCQLKSTDKTLSSVRDRSTHRYET